MSGTSESNRPWSTDNILELIMDLVQEQPEFEVTQIGQFRAAVEVGGARFIVEVRPTAPEVQLTLPHASSELVYWCAANGNRRHLRRYFLGPNNTRPSAWCGVKLLKIVRSEDQWGPVCVRCKHSVTLSAKSESESTAMPTPHPHVGKANEKCSHVTGDGTVCEARQWARIHQQLEGGSGGPA